MPNYLLEMGVFMNGSVLYLIILSRGFQAGIFQRTCRASRSLDISAYGGRAELGWVIVRVIATVVDEERYLRSRSIGVFRPWFLPQGAQLRSSLASFDCDRPSAAPGRRAAQGRAGLCQDLEPPPLGGARFLPARARDCGRGHATAANSPQRGGETPPPIRLSAGRRVAARSA